MLSLPFSLSGLNILVGLNSSMRLLALADVLWPLVLATSAVEMALGLMVGRFGLLLTNAFADCLRALLELPKFLFF